MNYRKAILGAASVLALTAGMQAAEASIPPAERAVQGAAASQANLLFDFVARTSGTFTPDTIEPALAAMFGNAGHDQIQGMPGFFQDLASLGLMPDTMADTKDALLRIVASASSISDDLRAAVTEQLERGNKSIQLAAGNGNDDVDNNHRPRDPHVVGAGGAYQ